MIWNTEPAVILLVKFTLFDWNALMFLYLHDNGLPLSVL